jgi:hypothetical protein
LHEWAIESDAEWHAGDESFDHTDEPCNHARESCYNADKSRNNTVALDDEPFKYDPASTTVDSVSDFNGATYRKRVAP